MWPCGIDVDGTDESAMGALDALIAGLVSDFGGTNCASCGKTARRLAKWVSEMGKPGNPPPKLCF